jgi:hypothetical protein
MIKSELVRKIIKTYPELYQRDADLIINTIFNEISVAFPSVNRRLGGVMGNVVRHNYLTPCGLI